VSASGVLSNNNSGSDILRGGPSSGAYDAKRGPDFSSRRERDELSVEKKSVHFDEGKILELREAKRYNCSLLSAMRMAWSESVVFI